MLSPPGPLPSALAPSSGSGAQRVRMSSPVTTVNTPGRRVAAEASIRRMRAWA